VSDPSDALASAKAAADRIVKLKRLNACLTPIKELRKSLVVQASTAHPSGVLYGMPVAVKDNICTLEFTTSCGSKILEGYRSPYEATAVAKLKAAGALIAGKTNCDEFGMGSSTEHSAYGRSFHPFDKTRVPGGSSGGSAALVAAGAVPAALGSETGGSVRQPASLCGVVGIKPTYGRVSRYGLVAFASSLDQIGPFTKDVRDSATLLEAMSGVDPRDSTSVPLPVPHYAAQLNGNIKGLKLGLPKEYMIGGLDPEVNAAVQAAVEKLQSLGAEVVEISLPHTDYAVATYYIIATAEASANLARFDGIRYGARVEGNDPTALYGNTRGAGFGAEVKRRIILGTYVLSSGYYDAYYLRAQKVRTLIRQDFLKAFEHVDAIVTPTTPTAAFKIGEKSDDPLQMYLSDIFTISCNLAGICGLSLPCGFTANPKLPIGLQLLGKPFGEQTILKLAHAYEQCTGWHKEKPALK